MSAPGQFEELSSSFLRNEEFIASGAYISAPLGGINEHSQDSSVVLNAPMGPDGFPMVFMWAYPESAPEKSLQGVRPVPPDAFKRGIKGGPPLKAASPTIDCFGDGVYRDGKMVQLFWTTATNYKRIRQIDSEMARRTMSGRGEKFQGAMAEYNETARRDGVTPFQSEATQALYGSMTAHSEEPTSPGPAEPQPRAGKLSMKPKVKTGGA
jgi:hypothetical protein